MTSLIEEGLRLVLTERVVTETSERRMPRVSTARGGLLPGIDPVKLNTATEEIEDFERLQRIEPQLKKP